MNLFEQALSAKQVSNRSSLAVHVAFLEKLIAQVQEVYLCRVEKKRAQEQNLRYLVCRTEKVDRSSNSSGTQTLELDVGCHGGKRIDNF